MNKSTLHLLENSKNQNNMGILVLFLKFFFPIQFNARARLQCFYTRPKREVYVFLYA